MLKPMEGKIDSFEQLFQGFTFADASGHNVAVKQSTVGIAHPAEWGRHDAGPDQATAPAAGRSTRQHFSDDPR
jgi:hypothetical protein